MASQGELENDMLFLGLTRPPMMFGVSYAFFGMNFFVLMMGFIVLNQGLKTFLLAPLIHGIGYYFSQKEPLFLELFMVKQSKCNKCKNKLYHNANSYDVM